MASPSADKIKVGFVGLSTTGWATTALAPSILQPSLGGTYDIVAVSTTSETSAQASADKYSKEQGHPVKAYFGATSKIASDPDVDFVAVSVKALYHKDTVLPVIEAKKDFFLEWPAGVTSKATEEIAEAARKHGVRSIIGLQGRHAAVVRKTKELLSSGIIGAVKSTNVFVHYPREARLWAPLIEEKNVGITPRKNGSTLFQIPVAHQLDTLTYVLGDFVNVSATTATFYPEGTIVDAEGNPTGKTIQTEIFDHLSVAGFLKSGIFANIFWRSGYTSTEGRRQFIWEIEGEEGTIRMESNAITAFFPSGYEPELYLNGKKVEFETPGNVIESLGIAWKEFADRDEPGHYATIEDAVKHKKLLDAIERSAKEGKRVTL